MELHAHCQKTMAPMTHPTIEHDYLYRSLQLQSEAMYYFLISDVKEMR